jgi:hypothetical protein
VLNICVSRCFIKKVVKLSSKHTKETSFVYQGKRGFLKHASSVVFLTFLCNCREIATLAQVGILTYKIVKYQQQVKKLRDSIEKAEILCYNNFT